MKIDYDVSVFIITEFNEYILPEDYDKNEDGEGIFVCLTNDKLNHEYGFNNSVCIHKNWRNKLAKSREQFFKNIESVVEKDNYITSVWQKNEKEIPNNERYNFNKKNHNKDEYLMECLDGYLGCKNIISNVLTMLKEDVDKQTSTLEEYIPAIMLAHHTRVNFNSKTYNGCLPAIGQLIFMSVNILKVDLVLNILGVNVNDQLGFYWKTKGILGYWWSSSQYSATRAWGIGNGSIGYDSKIDDMQVLPLFAV